MFDLKTAVIGVGSMGRHHARVYKEISNLVAVIDLDKEQGMKIAKDLEVNWYASFFDIPHSIDALTIAVPTSYHLDVFQSISELGISTLIEKPLSSSVINTKKILNLAQENSNKLMVGQIERFNPVIQFAKKELDSGNWGKIISISARRFSSYPNRITDVGVIYDLSIHDVDLINYLSGEKCISVYTVGSKSKDREEDVKILMEYTNDINVLCETSWFSTEKVRELVIITDKSYIKLDLLNLKIYYFSRNKTLEIPIPRVEPLKSEIENFLLYCIDNIDNPVTGKEGLNSVRIVEAALKSLEIEKKVNLNL